MIEQIKEIDHTKDDFWSAINVTKEEAHEIQTFITEEAEKTPSFSGLYEAILIKYEKDEKKKHIGLISIGQAMTRQLYMG